MLIVCSSCGGVNRVAEDKLGHGGAKCGKCASPLFPAKPVAVSSANFMKLLESSDQTLVVDFWAPWCGPCKVFAPTFEQLAAERRDLLFIKVNTEDQQDLAARFAIRSIPTLMVFKDAQVVKQVSGALPLPQFKAWLPSR